MREPRLRDLLLVAAPLAAVAAGLSAVDHHQRLVDAGYRVAALEAEVRLAARENEGRRVRVGALAAPGRLLEACRDAGVALDYPKGWGRVEGPEEAARLVASWGREAAAAPAHPRPAASKSPARRGKRGSR